MRDDFGLPRTKTFSRERGASTQTEQPVPPTRAINISKVFVRGSSGSRGGS